MKKRRHFGGKKVEQKSLTPTARGHKEKAKAAAKSGEKTKGSKIDKAPLGVRGDGYERGGRHVQSVIT